LDTGILSTYASLSTINSETSRNLNQPTDFADEPIFNIWILYEEENQEAATSSSSLFQISAFNFLLFFNPGRAMPPHLSADLLVICDWYQ